MDAFVQLAIIEKAKRVFSDDPKVMLCFPLREPIGFTEAELSALSSPQTARDYAVAADFARVVNFLPKDMVATATERMLWEVMADVLTRAEVAKAENAVMEPTSACSLLYDVGPDGKRVDSQALKRYRQYRDAWFVARENYGSRKLTGELSEDAEVRQRWFDVEEPALRVDLDTAMMAWDALGDRMQIELAMQAERQAAMRNPQLRWAEWSRSFNPDTDMLTEANGGRFAPTGLSPRDFAAKGNWLTFELSSDEMAALVREAPAPFKALLNEDDGRRFERISFEYRSVAINRPWFLPEVLTSQIWRTNDPELKLSDGDDPPSGECPAYATAVVFLRNLKVIERGSESAQPSTNLRFTLNPNAFILHSDAQANVLSVRRKAIGVDAQRSVAASATTAHAFNRVQDNSFSVPIQNPEAVSVSRLSQIRVKRVPGAARSEAVSGILVGPEVIGEPSTHLSPPPPPPERAKEISVLAFICKRLPKAPDPAPTLHWG